MSVSRYGDPSPPGSPVDWEAMKQGELHRYSDHIGLVSDIAIEVGKVIVKGLAVLSTQPLGHCRCCCPHHHWHHCQKHPPILLRFLELSGTSPSMTSSEDIQQRMEVWDRLLGTTERNNLK